MNGKTAPVIFGSSLAKSGVLLALGVALTACGGPPTWVTDGSGALHKKDEKAFYGVGSVVGVTNEPLAWDTAENRARAELARNFETYTAYVMRDYAAATQAGDFTTSTEEQNVQRAIKTVSAVTLSGARPIGRYKDSETHTYYVLATLSLEDLKHAIVRTQELNSEVRDFVRHHAERLFERLEQEEHRYMGAKRGAEEELPTQVR